MNKKLLLFIPTLLLVVSCSTTKPQPVSSEQESNIPSSVSNSSEESEELSSEESSESSSIEEQYDILEKQFVFKDTFASNNYGIADTEQKTADFLAKLNQIAEIDDLFTDISVTKCFFNIYGQQTDKYTFVLGSSSALGTISLTAKYDISQISVLAQPYNKYVAYTETWNIDGSVEDPASLTIKTPVTSGQELYFGEAEYHSSGEPGTCGFNHTVDKPTNSFTIEGLNHRTLIHRLTVKFKVPK